MADTKLEAGDHEAGGTGTKTQSTESGPLTTGEGRAGMGVGRSAGRSGTCLLRAPFLWSGCQLPENCHQLQLSPWRAQSEARRQEREKLVPPSASSTLTTTVTSSPQGQHQYHSPSHCSPYDCGFCSKLMTLWSMSPPPWVPIAPAMESGFASCGCSSLGHLPCHLCN